MNIDGVARLGDVAIGIDRPTEDVGSGMVFQPNVYPIGSIGTLIDIGSKKPEVGDSGKGSYR